MNNNFNLLKHIRYICMYLFFVFLIINLLKNLFIFIYLFIWLHQVLVAACGIFLATCGIFNCGMWTLMQDLVPWPGIEPWPPALGAQSLSHWITREVPIYLFFKYSKKRKRKPSFSCPHSYPLPSLCKSRQLIIHYVIYNIYTYI